MKQETAEIGAVRVLAWLAADAELLGVFLGATGAGPDDLRRRAGDPEFLASVLDFVLMDDAWVIACSRALDLQPEALARMRQALPGGALPNWT